MRKIYGYNNSMCIDCNSVIIEMTRVGAFIMCINCCEKIFPTGYYDSSSPEYKERLKRYMEEFNK